MCCCGEIGVGQTVTEEPIPSAHQCAEIGKMKANAMARRTDNCGIRRSAASINRHVALVLFGRKRAADLGKEFVVEPTHEPTYFDPREGTIWHQPSITKPAAPVLVEI